MDEILHHQLTEKQQAQLNQAFALEKLPPNFFPVIQSPGVDQTRVFHACVGLTITYDWAATPPVSERILRGKLLIEEVLETLEAMGLTLCIDGVMANQALEEITVAHVEGSRYCPVETADGLADIKVIANGTAVAFGIPQSKVDVEVWASNMTKLGENGNPIVNRCPGEWDMDDPMQAKRCNFIARGMDCTDVNHLPDPTKPVGKVLKPDTYTPANIARLFVEHVNNDSTTS